MQHITTVTSTTEALCFFAILACALAALALLIVHFLPTGVNPISDAVSDIGVGEYKNFYRLAAFWLGAAGLLLAIALADAMFPKPTLTIVTLLVFAAVRWAIIIFPTDLPGEEETSVGRSHFALAAIAFTSIAVAAWSFYAEVHNAPLWREYSGAMLVLPAAVVVTAAATGLTRAFAPRVFGLAERMLYVSMFAWIAGIAAIMLGS